MVIFYLQLRSLLWFGMGVLLMEPVSVFLVIGGLLSTARPACCTSYIDSALATVFISYIIPNSQHCFLKSNSPLLLSHYHKSFRNPTLRVAFGYEPSHRSHSGAGVTGMAPFWIQRHFSSLPAGAIYTTGHLAWDVFLIFHFETIGGRKRETWGAQ